MHARSLLRALCFSAAALGTTAALATSADEAMACGGFFCNVGTPVDQAGEEILFAVDGTDITAHIRIEYQGTAEDFAWVLPVPNLPSFGVGSDEVFNALRRQTDPRFEIEWDQNTNCYFDGLCQADFDSAPTAGGVNDDRDGVTVLASGSVGPFEYKVVEGESGQALYQWLDDNGYDQPPTARALIEDYVRDDHVFVALKLLKDAEVGEIQPIVLEFESPTLACIPLRLTSIAANPNMPVTTWVLGQARAVPMNYFHVTLNPNAFDWLNCGVNAQWGGGGLFGDCRQSYLDLVTAATNQVNGHGFITEYAGTTDLMDDQIYTTGRLDTASLAGLNDPELFLSEMLAQGFPRTPLVQQIIREWVPKPAVSTLPDECKDDSAFYNWNLQTCLQYMPADWTFEPTLFAQDLDNRIVQPLADGQALFDSYGYMTRMFTTQSPDEMNRDPMFSFNPDLPDVSNVHTVQARAVCKPNSNYDVQYVELTLPDGTVRRVTGEFQQCGGFVGDSSASADEPALARIQVMDEAGAPIDVSLEEIDDWDDAIEMRVANPNQSMIPQRENPLPVADSTGTFGQTPRTAGLSGGGTGDCDCQVRVGDSGESEVPLSAALGALGLLGVVALRRRRR